MATGYLNCNKQRSSKMKWKLLTLAVTTTALLLTGCNSTKLNEQTEEVPQVCGLDLPCTTGEVPIQTKAKKGPKQLWAQSYIWAKAPKIEIERWYNGKAVDMKDKYIMLEFWSTWCSQCRRMVPKLGEIHKKYKDELALMVLTDEDETTLAMIEDKYDTKLPDCPIAIDTQNRTKNEYKVLGIPHAVIIEPFSGCVIWEGFPNLPGHELTNEKIEEILRIGREIRAQQTK